MNLLLENIQNAKALLKKLNIPEDNRDFLQIKTLLSKKVGWVYWFCKLRFVSNTELSGLIEIYNYLEQNKNIVSKMGDITRFNNLEEIYDEVESLKLQKEVLSLYNEFPKTQKELINLNTDSPILKSLYDRKDRKDFLIKISRYKKRNDLINAIKDFINVNPNESIKNMIEICNKNNISIKIIKNDCLVIIAKNSKDIKAVAGDTSWCIKSQHMFDNYNKKHESICIQYVLYLPNEKVLNLRKIGVTINSSNKNKRNANRILPSINII